MKLVVMVSCLFAMASLLFVGCGSASLGEYEREVSAVNELAAEKMTEISKALGEESPGAEESHEDEAERLEAMVLSLEEAIESLNKVIMELEDVKVPEGMEDFHRSLLAFYQGNLHAYEALLTTLEPEGAHGGEVASHGEEETTEHHEEEAPQEEESSDGGH